MKKIEIAGFGDKFEDKVFNLLDKNKYKVAINSYLIQLAKTYDQEWPDHLPMDVIYIIIDSESQYKNHLRRIAIRYQILFLEIDNIDLISSILNNTVDKNLYTLPNPDNFSQDDFDNLPLVIEGESKIIRSLNNNFNLIAYKSTVYSHKQQRAGIVSGTNTERMQMTKDMLYILDMEQIPHAYWYIGKNYVLCEKLDPTLDIPPIEIIVKRCCVGTDKHRYFNIDSKQTRFNTTIVAEKNREYPKLIVRFDYRNPNYNAITNMPMGDEVVCDDLADLFINVDNAKKLASNTFQALIKHFDKMGIYFEDVCFMLTTDGLKHYSEISQDCGRYKKITGIDTMDSLDKDVWRAGGSSDLVLLKWKKMTEITHQYVKRLFSKQCELEYEV